jgi:hypothetical protein
MSHAPVVMRQVAPAGVYSGVLSVAKDIMAKEGLKGFYRGLVPVIVRAFPANAACFLVGVHCLFLPCHCQPCHSPLSLPCLFFFCVHLPCASPCHAYGVIHALDP